MKPTFVVIAGPCVIESEDMVMQIAKELYEVVNEKNVQFYFKASFDKANRTSIDSYRGPGLEKGLSILQKVKDIYNFGIVTDIHEPWQAKQVAKVAYYTNSSFFMPSNRFVNCSSPNRKGSKC